MSFETVALRDLQGVQEARVSHHPPYASTFGDDAIELAAMVGIELDPWQATEIRHQMGESAEWKCSKCPYRAADREVCPQHPRAGLIHPWAAFECCDVDPRQNGKSEKLVVRQLAGLFLIGEPLQIYSAHLFDTAMEIFRRLVFLVENCDDLRREVKHRGSKMVGIKYSHGEEGIELQDGRRIRFKARTAGGGRGFSCDTLYLDEAMILRESFLGATVPTMSARTNPQLWLAGSAPDDQDPSHDGVVLTRRRHRAMRGSDPSLAYFEHSAEGESPDDVDERILDDPRQWALANPALGRRITGEYVANERRAMGPRQFAVERLGIGCWSNLDAGAGRIIPADSWAMTSSDPRSRVHSGHVFALDIDPGQAWATIAAAGIREDGLHHIGVVEHDRGTKWVVERVVHWLDQFPDARLVIDPRADLGSLIRELEDAGVDPVRTAAADVKDACGGFLQAVLKQQLRYRPPQPELDAAVAAAETKPLLDAWKWSRASSVVITPLVAVTLALWGVQNAGSQFTTVLYASDSEPDKEEKPVGVQAPEVLSQDETTSCFACRVGSCTVHT